MFVGLSRLRRMLECQIPLSASGCRVVLNLLLVPALPSVGRLQLRS
jgi:hypothetical protein